MYGYARVSVREPEDKNLDLQVELLIRAGCSTGNIRAEEAIGAKNDRGGLLELLDLVVEGDTLMVTHIDRLSRGLTHGLQVIEGLHRAGVEFRSLSEDFDTSTATSELQLSMVLAFSEWWRNSMLDNNKNCEVQVAHKNATEVAEFVDRYRLEPAGRHRSLSVQSEHAISGRRNPERWRRCVRGQEVG